MVYLQLNYSTDAHVNSCIDLKVLIWGLFQPVLVVIIGIVPG